MKEESATPFWRIIGAMFLVAGTCIGGGMLALPVASGMNGFVPSVSTMLLCWVMMSMSALLVLEVTLSMEPDVHVMTMASRLLGRPGQALVWLLFLYVSYASVVAYTAGGGVMTAGALEYLLGYKVGKTVGCFVFVAAFGIVTAVGARIVSEVNGALFVCLLAAYVVLLYLGGDEVNMEYLQRKEWKGWWMALPLLLTGFSHQVFIIPTLTRYLDREVNWLRISLLGGTTLTLVVYLFWQWLILGTVPLEGEFGLQAAYNNGEPATEYMRYAVESPWVSLTAQFFGYFAVATSFLGMALGLFDFLRDGFHLHRTTRGRMLLGALVVVPTFLIAIYFERAFLVAMDTSGGIGDTLLNGMLPVLMVWMIRYRRKIATPYTVKGGKLLLIGIFLFYLLAFLQELYALGGPVLLEPGIAAN